MKTFKVTISTDSKTFCYLVDAKSKKQATRQAINAVPPAFAIKETEIEVLSAV